MLGEEDDSTVAKGKYNFVQLMRMLKETGHSTLMTATTVIAQMDIASRMTLEEYDMMHPEVMEAIICRKCTIMYKETVEAGNRLGEQMFQQLGKGLTILIALHILTRFLSDFPTELMTEMEKATEEELHKYC